jgi:hypothetical protein
MRGSGDGLPARVKGTLSEGRSTELPAEGSDRETPRCLMEPSTFAKFHRITFDLDIDSGWYIRRPAPIHFAKVPGKLKVEQTGSNGSGTKVPNVITGPMRDKRRTFYTGLRQLPVEGWYVGNDYEQRNGRKVLSLVLFQFSADHAELTVYYFNGYYRAHLKIAAAMLSHSFRTSNDKGPRDGPLSTCYRLSRRHHPVGARLLRHPELSFSGKFDHATER